MKIEKPVYSVDLGTPHTVSTSMFVLSGAASVPPTPQFRQIQVPHNLLLT
jgi:hypothetical protein